MTDRKTLIESIGPDAWPDDDAEIIEGIREAIAYKSCRGYAKYLLGDALWDCAIKYLADVEQIESERVGE